MRFYFLAWLLAMAGAQVHAQGDYLVKVAPQMTWTTELNLQARLPQGSQIEDLGIDGWLRIKIPAGAITTDAAHTIVNQPGVLKMQSNSKLSLMDTWSLKNAQERREFLAAVKAGDVPHVEDTPADNPPIPQATFQGAGADPLYSQQWGMNQMHVRQSWAQTKGDRKMIVAVIDSGVDYTHEDLVDNIWRNPGENGLDANGHDKATNGIDDDNNGYVDDAIGWDFVSNDNKPYDLKGSMMSIVLAGANPGHGTHCAGNVAARADNGKGISGVAPNVQIMPLRFISQDGQGSTADAIKAIKYAVDNGAKVLSNSWGSEGDDPDDKTGNQALHDAITYAQSKGVLFVAAAGNGHEGVGYDNDTDSRPGVPASYDNDNIISVAAIDENGQLGSFSNWGLKSVDLAAPGVKVFSTTVGNTYSDVVLEVPILGAIATWDGTSMATPHVAGAAALYWSAHPNATWQDVKAAILESVKKTSVLAHKTVSGGQLDVQALMKL